MKLQIAIARLERWSRFFGSEDAALACVPLLAKRAEDAETPESKKRDEAYLAKLAELFEREGEPPSNDLLRVYRVPAGPVAHVPLRLDRWTPEQWRKMSEELHAAQLAYAALHDVPPHIVTPEDAEPEIEKAKERVARARDRLEAARKQLATADACERAEASLRSAEDRLKGAELWRRAVSPEGDVLRKRAVEQLRKATERMDSPPVSDGPRKRQRRGRRQKLRIDHTALTNVDAFRRWLSKEAERCAEVERRQIGDLWRRIAIHSQISVGALEQFVSDEKHNLTSAEYGRLAEATGYVEPGRSGALQVIEHLWLLLQETGTSNKMLADALLIDEATVERWFLPSGVMPRLQHAVAAFEFLNRSLVPVKEADAARAERVALAVEHDADTKEIHESVPREVIARKIR